MASTTLKKHLRELRAGKPGHRFQDHYRHEKAETRAGRARGRMWRLAGGILCAIVGLVLCVIPGPGLPFIFLGGGLLASESLIVARGMDWLELRVRAVARWAGRYWRRLPVWGRVVVAAVAIVASAGGAVVFYRLLRN